jgi:hypothetical protein
VEDNATARLSTVINYRVQDTLKKIPNTTAHRPSYTGTTFQTSFGTEKRPHVIIKMHFPCDLATHKFTDCGACGSRFVTEWRRAGWSLVLLHSTKRQGTWTGRWAGEVCNLFSSRHWSSLCIPPPAPTPTPGHSSALTPSLDPKKRNGEFIQYAQYFEIQFYTVRFRKKIIISCFSIGLR